MFEKKIIRTYNRYTYLESIKYEYDLILIKLDLKKYRYDLKQVSISSVRYSITNANRYFQHNLLFNYNE